MGGEDNERDKVMQHTNLSSRINTNIIYYIPSGSLWMAGTGGLNSKKI